MKTKLRVALIALHFAEYSANLAMALAEENEVLLVLYRDNADNELGEGWQKWTDINNLQIVILDKPNSALAVIKNGFRLISIIKKFGPSIIHCQEGIRDELAFVLPLFRSVPRVLTVHDPVPHSGSDSTRLRFSRLRFYRFLIRRSASAAITHGIFLVTALERECSWLKGKVWAVAHGPLGLRNAPTALSPSAKWNLLFFGRINQYKGLRFFVEAVIKLRNEGLPVTGIVAGRGGDLEHYRSAMDKAGCFKVLDRFIPSADVPKLFQDARAVVLPYTDGTQSGVAAMALGFGRPVVATTVGSIPELVRHNRNGLLVAPNDVAGLTDAIRSVVLDDTLWTNLAQGALELRDHDLSWKSIGVQMQTIYGAVINGTFVSSAASAEKC